MDQIQIGLWVTAGLLVLVVMGMRVAFAAALAGVVGLILILIVGLQLIIGGLVDLEILKINEEFIKYF